MIKQQQTHGEALSDALLQLYAMPENVGFFEQVLNVMQGYVPFQVSGYSIIDIRAKALDMKILRNQEGNIISNLSELEMYVLNHPLRDVCYQNNRGPVVGTIDLLPEKEWKKTPLYNEVHRTLGLVHDTSMRFYMGFQCVSFAFCDTKPLSQDYYKFLSLIAPHLTPAHKIFQLQRKGLLEHLPEDVVMISNNDHLEEISPSAAVLLNKYYPTRKRNIRQLPDEVWDWFRHRTHKDISGQTLVVQHPDSRLSLNLLRTPNGHLIVLEEYFMEEYRDILFSMGLTKRESEVILWVSQGKKNAEVAGLLE